MSDVMSRYQLWTESPYFDTDTRKELQALEGNESEINDRFYRSLEFGTGGLRGLIGAGTNRVNRYTIRQATEGLARYIAEAGETSKQRGVVIAHDPRHFSKEFAQEAGLTLNAQGIRAYLWPDLRPTPMLSFAIRELGTIAGIVVTASHNPPTYNGYKVYWEDGGQVPPERAAAIYRHMQASADLTQIHPLPGDTARAQGLLRDVPTNVDQQYHQHLQDLVTIPRADREACRVLYTPLHGAGYRPVRAALTAAGFPVSVVAAQAEPDPNFSTVRYPNPEEPAVYTLALEQAHEQEPDIIMATDPDADRLGVLARDNKGQYQMLTGNQLGGLLVDYVLTAHKENNTLPANGAVIKSIATSNLIAPLCQDHGVALLETHTGFKFIGDKIREFEETRSHTFLFGFEESYGYLGATFVRDKDAVMAALLVAQLAAYHKAAGRTLLDALERIWQRCGYFCEDLHSVTLPGQDGQKQVAWLMTALREQPPLAFAGLPVAFVDDYRAGQGIDVATGRTYPLTLGTADVLHYRFADGGFVMVRPSGTEPKLKLYFSVQAGDRASAAQRLQAVRAALLERMGLAEE